MAWGVRAQCLMCGRTQVAAEASAAAIAAADAVTGSASTPNRRVSRAVTGPSKGTRGTAEAAAASYSARAGARARMRWARVRASLRDGSIWRVMGVNPPALASRRGRRGHGKRPSAIDFLSAVTKNKWMVAAAALGVRVAATEGTGGAGAGEGGVRMLSWRGLLRALRASTELRPPVAESAKRTRCRVAVIKGLFDSVAARAGAIGAQYGTEDMIADIGELRSMLRVASDRALALPPAPSPDGDADDGGGALRECVIAAWLLEDEDIGALWARYEAAGLGTASWPAFKALAQGAFEAVSEAGHVLSGRTRGVCDAPGHRGRGVRIVFAADLFCCACERRARAAAAASVSVSPQRRSQAPVAAKGSTGVSAARAEAGNMGMDPLLGMLGSKRLARALELGGRVRRASMMGVEDDRDGDAATSARSTSSEDGETAELRLLRRAAREAQVCVYAVLVYACFHLCVCVCVCVCVCCVRV